MHTKTRNNTGQYMSRASLASAVLDKTPRVQPTTEHQKRNAAGTLDNRWYIQLPPKR